MKRIFLAVCIMFTLVVNVTAETTVKIDAAQTGSPMSPYIYGQFIEHLGRCINGGGIWAEMLEDRKFFYPVGDKDSPWFAWRGVRGHETINHESYRPEMDVQDPFVGKHTPKLNVEGFSNCLAQRGLALRKGKKYNAYIWLKCTGKLDLYLEVLAEVSDDGTKCKHFNAKESIYSKIPFKAGEYYRHDFAFVAPEDADNAALFLLAENGIGTVHVGTMSLMPADNVNGMRADTLELLKRLNSPVYRWPGGNFVSGYDWKDGIGDRDRRPPRKNPAWKGVEPNDFGLDEFMQFCNILNTEPYIAVNTGDGGVKSAVEELEYANGPADGTADTPMGKLRKANGHAEPYNVVWWGIGNEMYGNWQIGHMAVEKYVEKNNEFVDAFRKADSKVKCVAVGHVGKWDEVFLPGAAKHMDLISEHFYVKDKKNITEHAWQIPKSIKRIADEHRKYRQTLPNFKNVAVPIALDEWNYWYGDHVFGELGTRYFQKDGLGIAAGLHEFARQADMYFMANYAQTVNVIGCIKTSKTAAQMETTGLVLELYRKHFGNVAVKTECENKNLDVQAALVSKNGLAVGIVNMSDKEETVKLDVAGFDVAGKPAKCFVIADPQNDPQGFNDPDRPQRITIVETELKSFGGSVVVKPYSITLLRF